MSSHLSYLVFALRNKYLKASNLISQLSCESQGLTQAQWRRATERDRSHRVSLTRATAIGTACSKY